MKSQKITERYICCECLEDILPGEEAVLFWDIKDDPRFTHAGKCWDKYKPFLFGSQARKDGAIVGMCAICLKPIRTKQWYRLDRMMEHGKNISRSEEDNILETTFPFDNNKVGLVHDKCFNEMTEWGEFNEMMQDEF